MWTFITNPIVTHAFAVLAGVLAGWWTTLKAHIATVEAVAKVDWDKFKAAAAADVAAVKKVI
jgi:hypothetical protein